MDMSIVESAERLNMDKFPPHSIEAEQAVLGGLLVNGEAITRVSDLLEPDYFYRRSHQLIYAAMLDLFERSEPLDIVTVTEYLKGGGQLESCGGRQYLADLAMSVATTANIEYYARMVYQKALLRNLIKAGTEIVQGCYEEPDGEAAIDNAEHLIFSLSQQKSMHQLMHIKDIVDTAFQKIEQRYENKDSLAGITSGFYDLDMLTSGFQQSDLIVVAARPSMGKTAFCLNVAATIAIEHHIPVAVFSLEMSREQVVQRMLCSEAGIDAAKLKSGYLQSDDWTRLSKAMGSLSEAPIYIDDSPLLTALAIRAKARRLKAEIKNLGLIVIDYIQLMQGRRSTDNRQQEVSEISRGLKTLARELDIPVVALSQLSRAVEARQNKRPMLSDLRESGSIEQDADIVMFIYRDEYYNPDSDHRGEAEIIVAKQRNGPTGHFNLLFQASITRFLNRTHAPAGS